MIIKQIICKLRQLYVRSSSERYIHYLRSKGVQIGTGNIFRPKSVFIDITRPSLVTIGNDCLFNENFSLLTHDFVSGVFRNCGRELIPSSGKVTIGNNVRFGWNVMVLKGVTIGDNCFIGAGSIVTKDIPANSVASGYPCKVLTSLDDYYQKRQEKHIDEALDYARSIKERYGRRPLTTDFWEEFTLFVDGDKIGDYPELASTIKRQCGKSYESYVKNHKGLYNGFDDFLKAAGIE